MNIADIIDAIRNGRVHLTDHADRAINAHLLELDDVLDSVFQGTIIEDYPDDRPFPSCLVYGDNLRHEPVHSVWAYNASRGLAILVTAYRPDAERWDGWRIRR